MTGKAVLITMPLSEQSLESFRPGVDTKPSRDGDALVSCFEIRARWDLDVVGAI